MASDKSLYEKVLTEFSSVCYDEERKIDVLIQCLPVIDRALKNGHRVTKVLRFIANEKGWAISDGALSYHLFAARKKAAKLQAAQAATGSALVNVPAPAVTIAASPAPAPVSAQTRKVTAQHSQDSGPSASVATEKSATVPAAPAKTPGHQTKSAPIDPYIVDGVFRMGYTKDFEFDGQPRFIVYGPSVDERVYYPDEVDFDALQPGQQIWIRVKGDPRVAVPYQKVFPRAKPIHDRVERIHEMAEVMRKHHKRVEDILFNDTEWWLPLDEKEDAEYIDFSAGYISESYRLFGRLIHQLRRAYDRNQRSGKYSSLRLLYDLTIVAAFRDMLHTSGVEATSAAVQATGWADFLAAVAAERAMAIAEYTVIPMYLKDPGRYADAMKDYKPHFSTLFSGFGANVVVMEMGGQPLEKELTGINFLINLQKENSYSVANMTVPPYVDGEEFSASSIQNIRMTAEYGSDHLDGVPLGAILGFYDNGQKYSSLKVRQAYFKSFLNDMFFYRRITSKDVK